MDYEDFEGDENTVDLRAYHVVGGVLHFNLLQMPPQPKVVRGWTITQRMLLFTQHYELLLTSSVRHAYVFCVVVKQENYR